MPSTLHDFFFDLNFGFGDESVFAWIDLEGVGETPTGNFLLLTDTTPLLLTDGSDFLLAA